MKDKKNPLDMFESRSEEIQTLKEEIEKLQNDLLELTEKIERTEDYELYASFSKMKMQAEFDLRSKQKHISELMQPVPVEDARSALKPFYDDYNRKFNEAMADYKKARHALYKQFLDLVELQRTATEMRSKAARACGILETLYMDLDATEYGSLGMFQTIPNRKTRMAALKQCPDAEYFIASGEMPAEMDNYIYQITMHKG